MKREQQIAQNAKKVVTIFNPLDEDFVVNWDGKPLKPAKKLDFTEYPYYEGIHVKKHLIQAVINHRGLNPVRHHDEIKNIEKEVSDVR